MYSADRARFHNEIDKLSHGAAKTPLTSLLAGIKSATRPIACYASPDKAQQRGDRTKLCGKKTIGARSECKSASKLAWLAGAKAGRRTEWLTGPFFSSR
jgi:hypothetical protein